MDNVSNQIPANDPLKTIDGMMISINPKLDDVLEWIYGGIDKMDQDEVQRLKTILMDLYDTKAIQEEQRRQSISQDILISYEHHCQSVDSIYQLEDALSKVMQSTPGYYVLHMLESLITYCVNRLIGNRPRRVVSTTSNNFREANYAKH